VIEGPTRINRHSVIAANHYEKATRPHESLAEVMGGRKPKLLMDIHTISDVNKPGIDLSEIPGPATGDTFNGKPNAVGSNPTDKKAG
jgi:NADH-quinone oxidoreductase subunit G